MARKCATSISIVANMPTFVKIVVKYVIQQRTNLKRRYAIQIVKVSRLFSVFMCGLCIPIDFFEILKFNKGNVRIKASHQLILFA